MLYLEQGACAERPGKKKVLTQRHACAVRRYLLRTKNRCIFFFRCSRAHSLRPKRSHGVRHAPGHGNSQEKRVHGNASSRFPQRLSIKQRERVEPYGCTVGQRVQDDSVAVLYIFWVQICHFCTGNWHSRANVCMIGDQEHTLWSGKHGIYGLEIYPKTYERRKSLNTLSGEYYWPI